MWKSWRVNLLRRIHGECSSIGRYDTGLPLKNKDICSLCLVNIHQFTASQPTWVHLPGFSMRRLEIVGKVLKLKDDHCDHLYLVTKNRKLQKSRYRTLWKTLLDLKEQLLEYIFKIAMPKIECNKNELNWRTVLNMLVILFHDIHLSIVDCSYNLIAARRYSFEIFVASSWCPREIFGDWWSRKVAIEFRQFRLIV